MKSPLLLFVILIALISVSVADETLKMWPASDSKGPQGLAVWKVSLEADENGTLSYNTPDIDGKLYAVSWVNTTGAVVNGTLYLNTTKPLVASLENADLASGNATEYPRTSTLMYFLSGPMSLECVGCDANMTAEAWLYVEQ